MSTPVEIVPFDIPELTDKTIDGKGVLDVLLTTLRLQLDLEYNSGRIDGVAYADVFSDLYTANLNAAVNYVIQRNKLGYELANLELDGSLIAANIERAGAETEQIRLITTDRIPAEVLQIKANTDRTNKETTEMLPAQIANLEKQGEVLDQQILESTYRVEYLLPKELEKITADIAVTTSQGNSIDAQTEQTRLVTASKIPADVLQTQSQTRLIETQRDNLLEEMTLIPYKLNLLDAQINQVKAESALTNKNTDRVTAELAKIPVETELLRKQVLRVDADIELTNKQVEAATAELTKIPLQVELLSAQVANQTASTAQTEATTTRITRETELRLPVEIDNLTKQGENIEADLALTQARTNEVTQNLAKIPVEINYLQAQVANMAKQNLIAEKNLELKQGELDIQAQQIQLGLTEIDLRKQQLEVAKEQVAINRAQAELYEAKVITENAQTQGNIAQEGSVIDYNNKVLQGQIDGYKNDALQKATKIYLDAWMIGAQNEVREANTTNKLDDPSFGKVITSMLTSIDIVV